MNAIIQVHHLQKKFSQKKVLREVSFSVKKGEVFGLLGKNGAGKSTLIDCLLGIQKIDGGNCQILNENVTKLPKSVFENIGVQFQNAYYQEKIKVAELCRLTASYYKNPISWEDLLVQFGLGDKKKQPVQTLSGGEKQKLAILLTLIPNPTLIFLDELTTGLDTLARRQVWQLLVGLKEKGLTILLTSHYMEEVEILCDRVGILHQGKIVMTGSIPECLENSPYDTLEDTYLWYTEEENDAHF